jgi:hypothetical protein
MAEIYQPSQHTFPNLVIEERWSNGVMRGYRVTPAEGYVFYDSTANDTEPDPITGEDVPVIYYKTLAYLPSNCNFDNFPYVAVLRSSVDENYIFGGNDNNHEVM